MPSDIPEEERPPAELVVDILKRELPGFESQFDAGTDTFRVRGALRFGSTAVVDPIYRAPRREAGRAAERLAAELVFITRRNGIAALGIEAMIVEREERARREGVMEGDVAGFARGVQTGRNQMLAEILEAKPDPGDGYDDEYGDGA